MIRKMKDRRFRKTEEAIFKVFMAKSCDMSVDMVIKKVGISRSTFYRHHKSVYQILPDYEQFILDIYEEFLNRTTKRKAEAKIMIWRTLCFIFSHKKLIWNIIDRDNGVIIYKMLIYLRPRILAPKQRWTNAEKIYHIFACEVCGVVIDWRENDCVEGKFEEAAADIAYLTDTIQERLGWIGGKKEG